MSKLDPFVEDPPNEIPELMLRGTSERTAGVTGTVTGQVRRALEFVGLILLLIVPAKLYLPHHFYPYAIMWFIVMLSLFNAKARWTAQRLVARLLTIDLAKEPSRTLYLGSMAIAIMMTVGVVFLMSMTVNSEGLLAAVAFPLTGMAALFAGFGTAHLSRKLWGMLRTSEVARLALCDPRSNEVSQERSRLCVVHWSDLHLTANERCTLIEDDEAESPNPAFLRLLNNEVARADLGRANVVFITGDVTDSGHPEEWKRFFETFNRLPRTIHERVVLIPGNHDVNVIRFDPKEKQKVVLNRVEGRDRIYHQVRLVRALMAMDLIQGRRAKCLPDIGKPEMRLSEHISRYRDQLWDFVRRPPTRKLGIKDTSSAGQSPSFVNVDETSPEAQRARVLPRSVWDAAFPMVIDLDLIHGEKTSIFCLDTIDPADHLMENAFGLLREEQLRRLEALARVRVERSWIFLFHHHLGVPRRDSSISPSRWARIKHRAMTLTDGHRFVDFLRTPALNSRSSVLFHGHCHAEFVATVGQVGLAVVSARSTTLGDPSNSECGGMGYCVTDLDVEGANITILNQAARNLHQDLQPLP